jgi:tRNA threonylcarbamoyladenosine biosynthesis protein TsaB
MPILLAIDTAAPRLQLALVRADGSVETLVEEMEQGHAERILPAIGELLARNGIAYGDLQRIAVTTGPGSFTGLRIGLSAARGLALALGIPVLGVPSLEALALSARTEGPVAIVLDARRGESYVQVFGRGPSHPRILRAPDAEALVPLGATIMRSPLVDIAELARFAATADAGRFPPNPQYVRGADAKPQDAARLAKVPAQ